MERCLNDELLQGPDLTNLLVGVLILFPKEQVAFMGDIEAMFHQVYIPESQRSFMRFLWWPGGDVYGGVEDYEICVHSFGDTSSGGCAKFFLRKATKNGERQFGPEAARTVLRNFYMDDLLKSTDNIDRAKDLIMKLIKMCEEGGFKLTKFLSSNREVLKFIPTECLVCISSRLRYS